jgi:hypothetical protein
LPDCINWQDLITIVKPNDIISDKNWSFRNKLQSVKNLYADEIVQSHELRAILNFLDCINDDNSFKFNEEANAKNLNILLSNI